MSLLPLFSRSGRLIQIFYLGWFDGKLEVRFLESTRFFVRSPHFFLLEKYFIVKGDPVESIGYYPL